MIIRSQDKRATTTDLNMYVRENDFGKIKWEIRNSCQDVLGTYSTEEKAIKVLDEICAFANGLHFENIATDQCGRLDGIVFQMPQDSEV